MVFTLPHELNRLTAARPRVMLTLLFRAVAATLSEFGHRHPGGPLGFIAALHTWDQQLRLHYHLHCVVAGGAPSASGWLAARSNFLFAVRALSRVFRGKFLDLVRQAAARGDLPHSDGWVELLARLRRKPSRPIWPGIATAWRFPSGAWLT